MPFILLRNVLSNQSVFLCSFLKIQPKGKGENVIKIMIVDDDTTVPILIRMILGDLGEEFKFTLYSNPENALSDFSNEKPDIVITDFYMPEMNGVELAEKMRKINSKIKIIITSGIHSEIEKTKKFCKERDFKYFLEKPFHIKALKRIVKDILTE